MPAAAGSTGYVPNGLNQYSAVGSFTLAYDANGSLVSDGVWSYGYDVENRLVTATGPSVAAVYSYDPLGRRAAKSGTGVATTQFLSDGVEASREAWPRWGRVSPEKGLCYYRARYYAPAIGRFLQTDPVGYDAGLHLYAYVGNDPLNLVDPSGLVSCDKSLDAETCNLVIGRVDEARGVVKGFEKTISRILQKRVDGEELSSGEQGVLDTIESRFGSTSNRTLRQVARGLRSVNAFLARRDVVVFDARPHFMSSSVINANFLDREGSLRLGIEGANASIGLREGFFTSTPRQQARTFVHEAVHSFPLNRMLRIDEYYFRGNLYGWAKANPSKALLNPDSFACSVFQCP